jgi:hypothetical protein
MFAALQFSLPLAALVYQGSEVAGWWFTNTSGPHGQPDREMLCT